MAFLFVLCRRIFVEDNMGNSRGHYLICRNELIKSLVFCLLFRTIRLYSGMARGEGTEVSVHNKHAK